MTTDPASGRNRNRLAAAALIVVSLAVFVFYSNSLSGDFQFDDDHTVENNPLVKDTGALWSMNWINAYRNGERPLTTLSFVLNSVVSGQQVSGYHLGSVLIHIACTLLVFVFTRKTLLLSGRRAPEIPALIVAAFFGLHPLQSQAVSYLSQRAESLASLFYLLALILFIGAEERGSTRRGVMMYVAAVAAFAAAMGAKEMAVTLPAVFLLYSFYFLGDKPLLRRLAIPGPFLLTGILYAALRLRDLKDGVEAGFGVEGITPLIYLFTQFRVLTTYLRLAFFPVGQNLDYDYPLSSHFSDPAAFAAFMLWALLLFFAFRYRKRFRVASFGIFWFLLILAPTSSIVPIRDVIFEHRVYLPLWGIIAAAVSIGYELSGAADRRALSGAAAMILVTLLFFGAALHERNKVWQSKLSLWTDVAAKSPRKPRAHNNLGNCYYIKDDFLSAIPEYRRALELDASWHEASYNLAGSLERTGNIAEALRYYEIFLKEAPAVYEPQKQEILARFGVRQERSGATSQ